jgi:hypothetical protein
MDTYSTGGTAIEETDRLIASNKVEGTAVYNRRFRTFVGRRADQVMAFLAFLPNESPRERERATARTPGVFGGTGSSNRSSSSKESGANLSLAGIRLPMSRSRGFPRVCGLGRAARSAETRMARVESGLGDVRTGG